MSYEYYRDVYRGEDVPLAAFNIWSLRAQERLSADTCGRSDGVLIAAFVVEQAVAEAPQRADADTAPQRQISALSEQVRCAVCAMTEILYREREGQRLAGVVTCETVGGWSRSYAARDARETTRQLRAVQAMYLGSTGLLYRGRGR